MTGLQIAHNAKDQLVELTGLTADTVCCLEHDEQGWHVTVVMVEMRRIPNSQDMLANYECLLDNDGALITYNRSRRYLRQQAMEMEA
jgi:hypothetical protein